MLVYGTFEKENPILRHVRKVVAKHNIQLDLNDGPWIAGGVVRKIFEYDLSNNIVINLKELFGSSDLDIFYDPDTTKKLGDLNPKKKIAETIFNGAKKIISLTDLFESTRNDEVIFDLKIQLIEKKLNNVQELFNSFDFTVVAGATDGYNWVMDDRMITDIKNRRLNPMNEDISIKPYRVAKYCGYKFLPSAEVLRKGIHLDDLEFFREGLKTGFKPAETEDYL